MDLILKGGLIIDGSGREAYYGNIGVEGGRICRIGLWEPEEGEPVIDASGLLVCPGFIDVHSHSDVTLLEHGDALGKLTQGVTTEIIGNCGYSPFPLSKDPVRKRARRDRLGFIDVPGIPWDWHTYEEYCSRLKEARIAVNVGILAGYGSIRSAAARDADRIGREEQERVCELLDGILASGALGLSAGLAYAPDCFSTEEELLEAGVVAAKHNGVFAFHIRSDREGLFEAVREAGNIGLRTGAPIQISHIKCPSQRNHGRAEELLDLLESYRKRGVDITADLYPYAAGSTTLAILLPSGLLRWETGELLRRLEKRELFGEAAEALKGKECAILHEQEGENICISRASLHPGYAGRSLHELSNQFRLSLEETVLKIFLEEKGLAEILIHAQQEQDMRRFLDSPLCMIGSDGVAMNADDQIRLSPHPRYFGSFPRAFRLCEKTIGVEAFIHKTTALPARKFHLDRRGLLKEGYWADILLLDPEKLDSPASYLNPRQYCRGVELVMVNGRVAMREGAVQSRSGKILVNKDGGTR